MGQRKKEKNSLIRSSIRLRIPLEDQSEVIDILGSVKEQTQVEPTCIYVRLYRGVNQAEIIMIEELWEKEDELRRHLKSELYRRVLLAMELSEDPPEVRFDRVIDFTGFETIEAARKNGA